MRHLMREGFSTGQVIAVDGGKMLMLRPLVFGYSFAGTDQRDSQDGRGAR